MMSGLQFRFFNFKLVIIWVLLTLSVVLMVTGRYIAQSSISALFTKGYINSDDFLFFMNNELFFSLIIRGFGASLFLLTIIKIYYVRSKFTFKTFKKTLILSCLLCILFIVSSTVIEAPLVNADMINTLNQGYKVSISMGFYDYWIGKLSDNTYFAMRGSDGNVMTFIEPWQSSAPWARYADNYTALEQQVFASISFGTVYSKEVPFNYNLKIPANVTFIESVNGLDRRFISAGNSQGSPYTISQDTFNEGFYLVQDSASRYLNDFTSKNATSIIQNVINILPPGGKILFSHGRYTGLYGITVNKPLTIEGESISYQGTDTSDKENTALVSNGKGTMFTFNATSHVSFSSFSNIVFVGSSCVTILSFVSNYSDVSFNNCFFYEGQRQISCVNPLTSMWNYWFTDCLFEYQTNANDYAIYLDNSGNSPTVIRSWHFQNCYTMANAGGDACLSGSGISCIQFMGGHYRKSNGAYVFNIDHACNIEINGVTIEKPKNIGIYITNFTQNTQILNNRIYLCSYGIKIDSTNSNIQITANDLTQNYNAGIMNNGNSVNNLAITDNLGYNPTGYIINPLSESFIVDSGYNCDWVSAKNYTCIGSPKVLYVIGGAVLEIDIDGYKTGLTTGSFTLRPGDVFNCTASIMPTITVYGQ